MGVLWHVTPLGHSEFFAQSWKPPAGQVFSQVTVMPPPPAPPPPPPKEAQQALPPEHSAALVHITTAPLVHWPFATQEAPPDIAPVIVAQQSCVADLQVMAPHATVPVPPPPELELDPLPPESIGLVLASFSVDPPPEEEVPPPPESRSTFESGSSLEGSSSNVRPPHPIAPIARNHRPVDIVARMNVSPSLHGMYARVRK